MLSVLVLGVVMNLWTENYGFIIGYMGFVGVTLAISTITYDEYDNGNAFLFSLPITPKDYVEEKYLFGLLFSGGTWLVGTAGAVIMGLVKGSTSLDETLLTALVLLPMTVFMLAVMIPFQLKFGAEKGRIIRIGVMMLIFGIVVLGAGLVKKLGLFQGFEGDGLPALNMGTFAVIGIGVILAVLFLSWRISVSIMKKKEF